MEKDIILKWLNGSGYGYGYGSGYGNGYGSGYGDGYSEIIIKLKGHDVFRIDGLPTIITAIYGNYAKGFSVYVDYQLRPCYIAKDGYTGLFAHGKTLSEAVEALQEKVTENMTTAERINLFLKNFKKGEKYKGTEFFKWHNILTGSCLFGRNQFVKDKGLNLESAYSVDEFISLTEKSYGSDVISELKKAWREVK